MLFRSNERKYESAGGYRNYLIKGGKGKRTVSAVCALAAKHLVLAQRTVYYTTIAELVVSLRSTGSSSVYDAGESPTIFARMGKGYLIVGDIGSNVANWLPSEWDVVQSFLLSHIGRGGGLILGDTGFISQGLLCLDLADALTDFVSIDVE